MDLNQGQRVVRKACTGAIIVLQTGVKLPTLGDG